MIDGSGTKSASRNRKSRVVSFRLSPEAERKLSEAIEKSGLNNREWLEKAILENQTVIKSKAGYSLLDPDQIRELIFQANRAGNNINQIARALNKLRQQEVLDEAQYTKYLENLANIEQTLAEGVAGARSC